MTHPQVRPDPAVELPKLLADHWRRIEREQRGLRLLDGEPAPAGDPWETAVDRIRAREVLDRLGAHHRAAPRSAGSTRERRARGDGSV